MTTRHIAIPVSDSYSSNNDPVFENFGWISCNILKPQDVLVFIYFQRNRPQTQYLKKDFLTSKAWNILSKISGQASSLGLKSKAVLIRGQCDFSEAAIGLNCEIIILFPRFVESVKTISTGPAGQLHLPFLFHKFDAHDTLLKNLKFPFLPSCEKPPVFRLPNKEHWSDSSYYFETASHHSPSVMEIQEDSCDDQRRIAIGVDSSCGSDSAFDYVVQKFCRVNDLLMIFHCIPLQFNPGAGYGASSTFASLESIAKQEGLGILKRYTAKARSAGFKCMSLLVRGDPAHELVDAAVVNKSTLLVIGMYGRSFGRVVSPSADSVARWLWPWQIKFQAAISWSSGSVRSRVVRCSPVPVLVV